MHLRQATTGEITIGPFLDFSDGVTPLTSLVLTDSNIQLSKNGNTFVQKNDENDPTHYSGGWYRCLLDATDTDTVGRLIIQTQDPTSYLPVWHEFDVVEENIYDALYGPDAAGFDGSQNVSVAIASGDISLSAMQYLTDIILSRSVKEVEGSADKYSITRVILASTSWETVAGTGLQIKRTDGTEFDIVPIVGDEAADLITSVG